MVLSQNFLRLRLTQKAIVSVAFLLLGEMERSFAILFVVFLRPESNLLISHVMCFHAMCLRDKQKWRIEATACGILPFNH